MNFVQKQLQDRGADNLIFFGWLYKLPIEITMQHLAHIDSKIPKIQVLETWVLYDEMEASPCTHSPCFACSSVSSDGLH